jgi:hypothetical protein
VVQGACLGGALDELEQHLGGGQAPAFDAAGPGGDQRGGEVEDEAGGAGVVGAARRLDEQHADDVAPVGERAAGDVVHAEGGQLVGHRTRGAGGHGDRAALADQRGQPGGAADRLRSGHRGVAGCDARAGGPGGV